MKSKLLKSTLKGFLVALVLFSLVMISPRVWSWIYPAKPPVGYHFETLDYLALGVGLEELINKSPEVPADIEEIKNIEYKNVKDKSLQLDIYKPKNLVKPAPLLVFIHGGGWNHGNRSDYLTYLIPFAQEGYITATISYRFLKDGTYPACVEDVQDAIQWFFRNSERYGYDPDRIALIGGSAGGHLALLGAYGWHRLQSIPDSTTLTNHKIKAVVDIYGPVDFTTEYARNHRLITNFIAHSYEDNPELYREASPIQYVSKDCPPTMILHGTSDNLVPISQSDLLKSKLDSLGVPCVYYKVPLWPHTMDIAKRVNEYSKAKMNQFFDEFLKQ
ncbi:MAG: alpha/beta hydrolase [Prolixibacteraceae bacterium]|jgi:acetyl esterase/lipase